MYLPTLSLIISELKSLSKDEALLIRLPDNKISRKFCSKVKAALYGSTEITIIKSQSPEVFPNEIEMYIRYLIPDKIGNTRQDINPESKASQNGDMANKGKGE
jgi:hypothetical protein